VVRSTQTNSDNSKSTEATPSVSVQNNLPNADVATPAAGNQDQKQEETTNYEINKTVRTIAREQAQIHRISVAVMVDGTDTRAPDGTVTWTARPAEELERISRLVKSAIGFDAKRGDQVEVVSMRFAAAADDAAPVTAPGLFGIAMDDVDLAHLAQTGLVGLVAIAVLLLVVRPMVMRITTMPIGALGSDHGRGGRALTGPSGAAGATTNAAGQQLLSAPGADRQAIAGPDGLLTDESMVQVTSIEGQLRASSLRRLGALVEKHPEESIAIVRTWMQQEAA